MALVPRRLVGSSNRLHQQDCILASLCTLPSSAKDQLLTSRREPYIQSSYLTPTLHEHLEKAPGEALVAIRTRKS
ncbi:hypothetical protein CIHG_04926 [Coccidioides immitis H538.4]|uniref:Uncharacterized protein n=2 Tax=Coccidioides immitis TaxID=5501 RepID=A0A0J8QQV9_COCIT|nr:hypothetical protein CISG_04556 [Coccidioides immitis RMSCC 3703]KMU86986.1 hypothetical protein CIHG_04926 [Coccidioides immitis H538.4]